MTTKGLPLGLLDQKIFSRKLRKKNTGKAKPHDYLPIEEKESNRWLEALENTKAVTGGTQIITVCDREADLYDFFKCSQQIGAPVLVRANADRTINRNSRYAKKDVEKLWEHMRQQPDTGSYNNVKHSTEKLPDIEMHAVYVLEPDPPDSEESI
ncbi:MAG: IS4 family transposase, partial [Deltaproteobacteria bacterium]|nr:IS4 family transposase [Deltaproteobacteria bacterium]